MIRTTSIILLSATLLTAGLARAQEPVAAAPKVIDVADGDTLVLPITKVTKVLRGAPRAMYAYGGSIPGPVIRVRQGSSVRIVLDNRIDQPTTLHSHGVRLANAFDGVPGLTQDPVRPGERFTYRVDFPDAGVYWYHPHVSSWFQQELGLYGAFWVQPRDAGAFDPVDREEVLLLDDILLDAGAPLGPDVATHALMGRYGNVMLVNGRTDLLLRARRGQVLRLHFVNVANARPFRLAIPGARMKLVAGDAGRPARQQWVEQVVIGPSERYSVDVLFDTPGLRRLVNDTPSGRVTLARVLVSAAPGGSVERRRAFSRLRENQDVIAELDALRPLFDRRPDKRLVLSLVLRDAPAAGGGHGGGTPDGGHGGAPAPTPGMTHTVEGVGSGSAPTTTPMAHGSMPMPSTPGSTPDDGGIEWEDPAAAMAALTSRQVEWRIVDADTGAANMDIRWDFQVGDRVLIEIYNDPTSAHPMHHPIHFHGQRFLVLTEDGVPNPAMTWKDTVLVKAGSRVRILLEVTNPGRWVAHCHIPEHVDAGMELRFDARRRP